MKRRVHIINRVFWPAEDATAQLAHDLAVGLAHRGWEVHVVTASPGPAQLAVDSPTGATSIQILRTGKNAGRAVGLAAKARGYFRFIRAARQAVANTVQPGDHVIVKTDPPLLSVWLRRSLTRAGAHVFHWAQDIYPEVAVAIRPLGAFSSLLNLLRPARDAAWRSSAGIVTLGDDMAGLIRQRHLKGTPVTVVPNWPPAGIVPRDPTAVRQAWGVRPEDLVIGYSGNLGRAHDLRPLLELAAQLRDLPRVHVVVVGHGPQKAPLEAEARRRELTHIHFHPPVPRDQLGASLAAADLHLVAMREACLGMVWPSKFYGIMACHRPVLFFGPAEADIAHLIREHELGLAVDPAAVREAAAFVRDLVANPARLAALRDNVKQFCHQEVGAGPAIAAWHHLLLAASSAVQ